MPRVSPVPCPSRDSALSYARMCSVSSYGLRPVVATRMIRSVEDWAVPFWKISLLCRNPVSGEYETLHWQVWNEWNEHAQCFNLYGEC